MVSRFEQCCEQSPIAIQVLFMPCLASFTLFCMFSAALTDMFSAEIAHTTYRREALDCRADFDSARCQNIMPALLFIHGPAIEWSQADPLPRSGLHLRPASQAKRRFIQGRRSCELFNPARSIDRRRCSIAQTLIRSPMVVELDPRSYLLLSVAHLLILLQIYLLLFQQTP